MHWRNFKQIIREKKEWKLGNLFTMIVWRILCDHCVCLYDVHLYIRRMLTNREMVNFQKWDFLCPQRNLGRHLVIKLSARPSVRPASCPVYISYIMWGRNPKISMWMAKCRAYHCRVAVILTSGLVFRIFVSGANFSYYLR